MKVVIQRVSSAFVSVEGRVVSEIGRGLLILVGLKVGDDDSFDYIINKIIKMRIFSDNEGKMNLSVGDVGGEILLISQFTLYADCRKGNRPSFINAMPPGQAREAYKCFVERFKKNYGGNSVYDGEFGANMQVTLVNDGPVTIILED